jgi:hypothetical protein
MHVHFCEIAVLVGTAGSALAIFSSVSCLVSSIQKRLVVPILFLQCDDLVTKPGLLYTVSHHVVPVSNAHPENSHRTQLPCLTFVLSHRLTAPQPRTLHSGHSVAASARSWSPTIWLSHQSKILALRRQDAREHVIDDIRAFHSEKAWLPSLISALKFSFARTLLVTAT